MQNSDLEAKNTVETSSNEKFVGKNAELNNSTKNTTDFLPPTAHTPNIPQGNKRGPKTVSKMTIIDQEMKYTFPALMTNPTERETWTISTDHCYARPWNWRPEASFLRPTKTLFLPKNVTIQCRRQKLVNPLALQHDYEPDEDIIDVDTCPETVATFYDIAKAKSMMDECDKVAESARNKENCEIINRYTWTTTQNRVFDSFMTILDSFHMSRLSQTNLPNEALLRRILIDKSVQRVRRLLATITWDTKITQWLHQTLIDNLGGDYLAAYLDILRTLKAKVPSLVDKMVYTSSTSMRLGVLSNENLFNLLKKQWDPVANSLMQDKPKKLPGNVVIIMVPGGPTMPKRIHKWIQTMSNLAPVITVPTNYVTSHRLTMPYCLDNLFVLTRNKIQELRTKHNDKQIVLVGFNAGATLALQLAQVENVLCVISLGFSLFTAEGKRGEPDDNLLELHCPVLFVIGQCSNTSLQEDIEDLRERMRIESGLIVVGGADGNLRISKRKRKMEGITQSIVDRCIIDEIGEFIGGIILSPFPPQVRQSPTHLLDQKTKTNKNERKRYNSNTSSLDSEPPSPTQGPPPPPRLARPVGRPPGSKSKAKLEAKWAAQISQGTTNSSPPSTTTSPQQQQQQHQQSSTDTASSPASAENSDSSPTKLLLNKLTEDATTPFKKTIKTLKPIGTTTQTSPPKNQAKMQVYNLNRQILGGIKTISPTTKSPAGGIKILENIQVNQSTSNKLLGNQNRTVTVLNSTTNRTSTPMNNVVLFPDGKIKTIPIKRTNYSNLTPTQQQQQQQRKIVTSKRQLLGTKPPRSTKKLPFTPPKLTTQDILDLPIIFADDNKIIDSNNTLIDSTKIINQQTIQQQQQPQSGNKFVLVNKQANPGNFIITPSIKKSTTILPLSNKQQPRFTKIILSKKTSNLQEDGASSSKSPQPPSQSLKSDFLDMEGMDLEAHLIATTVPKPSYAMKDNVISIVSNTSLTNTMPSSSSSSNMSHVVPKMRLDVGESVRKRFAEEDESDPEYLPPKNIKLN